MENVYHIASVQNMVFFGFREGRSACVWHVKEIICFQTKQHLKGDQLYPLHVSLI